MSTGIILSPRPGAAARSFVHADASDRESRAGILHRPDQQRPHAQGMAERHAPLRGMVRRPRGIGELVGIAGDTDGPLFRTAAAGTAC
jgi:hypothetical protein